MTVRLAGLRAARLAQVGRDAALAKGNQPLHIRAHRAGQPDQNFKVGLRSCPVHRLFYQLQVAEAVGHRAALLIKTGRREDHIGQRRRLCEKEVQRNHKGFLQGFGVEAQIFHRVCAHHQQRT